MDREAWRAAIHAVAKSRTRLSDWTELNWRAEKNWSECFLMFFTFTISFNISSLWGGSSIFLHDSWHIYNFFFFSWTCLHCKKHKILGPGSRESRLVSAAATRGLVTARNKKRHYSCSLFRALGGAASQRVCPQSMQNSHHNFQSFCGFLLSPPETSCWVLFPAKSWEDNPL